MKRLAIALFGVLLATGCSSSSSTTSSPSTPGGSTTTRFTAALSPANETPPITNAESTGSGTATIDFIITRDASNTITNSVVNFQVNMQNFPSTAVVNIAHIHSGATGVAGPVLVNTTTVPGEVVLTNGAGSFTRNSISVPAATAQSILDNPAGFYFNVHTTLNPGGVMRGQLVKQ
ncbi:MAG TPA: CHRD domain-containing protein [Vicinamibacterales bacterium]|nr:CHRD domain-containing protein [Vicinamibacterales bacterium]